MTTNEQAPAGAPRRRLRQRPLRGAAALMLVGIGSTVGPGQGSADSVRQVPPERASTAASGTVDDAHSPSIAADGRWVVFAGTTDDGRQTVYRTDRSSGAIVELSTTPDATRTGHTVRPVISADGCVVAAITEINFDLFRDDDRDARWDVYRLVMPECGGQPNGWELVSSNERTGTARDDVTPDSTPTISASGALIAFTHPLDDAPEGVMTISVVDLTVPISETGRVQPVAGMPSEAPGGSYRYRGARDPVLSQNGRHLAFVADVTASDLLPGWGSGPVLGELATSQVYVWDRGAPDQRRAVRLISGNDGTPSRAGADSPAMSDDGRIVVFASADRNLVAASLPRCRAACANQIYRFDRDTDGNGIFDERARRPKLLLVSAIDAGVVEAGLPVAGNASSRSPAVNADGSQVAFVTDATNLLPTRRSGGGGPDDGDLVVAEVHLGQIRRVVDAADATAIAGAHARPALSKTGQVIAFDTAAAAAFGASGRRAVVTIEAKPQLSLAALDFGTVLLGFESLELYATVQNAGPAAFEPGLIETSSANFTVNGGTCLRGVIVAAGTSCEVRVSFNPTAPQEFSATLTVRGAGPGAPSVSTSLRGNTGDPALLTFPGGVELAAGVVGSVADRVALDIRNIGFAPTEVVAIDIGGAHPDDFRIVTESCTRRALNVDASCAVEVEFVPRGAGFRSALLIATAAPVTPEQGRPYTAAVLGGFGRYAPELQTVYLADGGVSMAGVLVRGQPAFVGGKGFPPNVEITIAFDGVGTPFATVPTSSEGTFLVELLIPSRARLGPRPLVASAPGGVVASLVVDVIGRDSRSPALTPGFGLG